MILSIVISSIVLILILIFGHNFSKRSNIDLEAIQSAHKRTTSRFGGVAVICGIFSIFFLIPWSSVSILILLSGFPIFLGGLIEDITGKVRPRNRLLAAFASALLAVILTGAYIQTGDFWLLDSLFIFPIITIPITILISSGIANSFNIIDGVNGFSSGMALIISIVLGYTCKTYGESNLSYFCFIIAIALIPFLLANFPFGFIFLGDAGAYTLGHLLSWIAITLMFRHPEISGWALLLLFFWPATEVILSIYRRLKSKMPFGAPDSFHFHQLFMQLMQLSFGNNSKIYNWANPLSTLILLPVASVPIMISLIIIENNNIAVFIYLILVAGYSFLYILLVKQLKLRASRSGNKEIANSLKYVFTPKK